MYLITIELAYTKVLVPNMDCDLNMDTNNIFKNKKKIDRHMALHLREKNQLKM